MERLEDAVRQGEHVDDLVLLLRGGRDVPDKLLRQAATLERRFTYAGTPARGISMFAARDADDERRVLAQKLPTFPNYRRVAAELLVELALLLPTFSAPHWTLLFRRPGGPVEAENTIIRRLLDVLGEPLENPAYRPWKPRR